MARLLGQSIESRISQCADRIVEIASGNMDRFQREIDKLNRRADKINCPHVRFEVLETKKVPDQNVVNRLLRTFGNPIPQHELDKAPHTEMNTIHVMGDGPQLDGWKFVGTLDHYSLPGKVIVNTVPGESVPSQYYDHEASCDQCNTIRRRIETFVLEGVDENEGEWKLVGRNCLRDFFGHDPMYVVRFLNRVWKTIENIEKDERWYGGFGGRVVHYYDAVEVLMTTAAVIRTFGWVPGSRSFEATPTSGHVRYIVNGPWSSYETEYDAWNDFCSTIKKDDDEDRKEAIAAVRWLRKQDASNEYMHNLKLLENSPHVPGKMIGYWCSLIATYQREQDRLQRAKAQNRINEHYGTISDRVEIRVKCTGVRHISGPYSDVTKHDMLTEEGHTIIWWANADAKMKRDQEYVIRARIKDHSEYKNWKQTTVSRLFVVEEI